MVAEQASELCCGEVISASRIVGKGDETGVCFAVEPTMPNKMEDMPIAAPDLLLYHTPGWVYQPGKLHHLMRLQMSQGPFQTPLLAADIQGSEVARASDDAKDAQGWHYLQWLDHLRLLYITHHRRGEAEADIFSLPRIV